MSLPDLPLPTPGQRHWAEPLNESLEALNDALGAIPTTEELDDAVTAAETARDQAQTYAANTQELQDAAVAGLITDPASAAGNALRRQFEPLFSVSARDYGVTGDGVTDDTEAWQLLFDTVPRGTTVLLPPHFDGARWSRVSDTITITTDSIRLVGPSSYSYNGGFVFYGVDRPMFVVKASGFQMENVALLGRSTDGADPVYRHQVGVDFYGGPLGDIDSQMLNCTIVSMGTAIKTRGRNLTVENTLFADNATDWDQGPKDPTYHDVTQWNIIRGLIARNCRIHTSGTPTTASFYIHDQVDYRHGIIEGCYFDNNCAGIAIKAVGLAGTPIRGLNIVNNRVFEAINGLIQLEHCDTPFISGNELYGTGAAQYQFDGIDVSNCPGATIMGNLLTRTGGHGIKARASADIAIMNNRMSIVGGAGTVGDGVNWSADCTRGRIDGLTISSAVGAGIAGKPNQGTVAGLSIRSTGPAVKDMTPPSSTVPATALYVTGGSPSLGAMNFTPLYLLDPDASEGVGTVINPPEGATQVALDVLYTGMGGGAGSVALQLSYTAPGGSLATQQTGTTLIFPVSGSAGEVSVARALPTIPATEGPVSVRVTRIATHLSDTYAGDIGISAIRLVQVF